MEHRRSIRLLLVPVALGALVAGCSDAQEEQEVIEGPEITEAPSQGTQGGGAGEESQVTAPVMVDSDDPVTLAVGQAIDVTTGGVTRVESSDTSVLSVSQPRDDGSATFNAGAVAESGGSAQLSVYVDGSLAYQVEVTVEG